MRPWACPYRTPAELREYLGALPGVGLLGVYEYPGGAARVRVVDPLGLVDDATREALRYWEREIWVAITGSAPRESWVPAWLAIERSRRGRLMLRYPRGDAEARYVLTRGRWQAW